MIKIKFPLDRFFLLRSIVIIIVLSAILFVGLKALSSNSLAATDLSKIKHVIIIMQENRSFDHYFGTYPGADGLANVPPGTCVKNLATGHCDKPFLTTTDRNSGGAHNSSAFNTDYDKGKMDGYLITHCPVGAKNADCLADTTDVMSYHDRTTLGNYWAYADNFVLQDHMFEPVKSASTGDHLALVSLWSASCTSTVDPMSCKTEINNPPSEIQMPWTDITYLLHKNNISWNYYLDDGLTPSCGDDEINQVAGSVVIDTTGDQPCTTQKNSIGGGWNPLPSFLDVRQNKQVGNVQPISNFFTSLTNGQLANVVWIVPNLNDSEHPPALVSTGQSYVTRIVNAIMASPVWSNSAIFIGWDDWGGFYDHSVPTKLDAAGYGIRVPGLLISPYAKKGYIDHQVLSHDAYTKFIEDVFLSSQRLDPKNDGRPDSRPFVREKNPVLGDLSQEFDFTQAPREPVILP